MSKEEKIPSYGKLLAENFRLEHNYKVLENRIDKAIEYIEENDNSELGVHQTKFLGKNDLLEILKGGSNE